MTNQLEIDVAAEKLQLEYVRIMALRDLAWDRYKELADQTDKAFQAWKNAVVK